MGAEADGGRTGEVGCLCGSVVAATGTQFRIVAAAIAEVAAHADSPEAEREAGYQIAAIAAIELAIAVQHVETGCIAGI